MIPANGNHTKGMPTWLRAVLALLAGSILIITGMAATITDNRRVHDEQTI
jgi:hypothetical protein